MAKAKTTKKVKPDMHQEIRHLGVLAERTDHNVRLMAEQHVDINKKLDIHTEMIGALATDLTAVKSDVEVMKQDVEFIKS